VAVKVEAKSREFNFVQLLLAMVRCDYGKGSL